MHAGSNAFDETRGQSVRVAGLHQDKALDISARGSRVHVLPGSTRHNGRCLRAADELHRFSTGLHGILEIAARCWTAVRSGCYRPASSALPQAGGAEVGVSDGDIPTEGIVMHRGLR